jgi:hypothetical protein
MRKRFGFILSFLFLLTIIGTVLAQQPRNPPAGQKVPAGNDLTIKYRTVMAGQSSESMSRIKGTRERTDSSSPYGGDSINILQCDLKRSIQLNEKNQKYLITPMQVTTGSETPQSEPVNNPVGEARRGGIVTYTTTATDTGERKEMFGFTARHVKTSISIESSPDACNAIKQRIETDGWYIDLAGGVNCEWGRPPVAPHYARPGGCQDQTRFRRQGAARTGYPLLETTTMYGADGSVTFSTSKEVVELSREPIQASVFEIPAGYTEAQSSQELYGVPSAESIASMAKSGIPPAQSEANAATEQKSAGTLRIGVIPLNNKTGRTIATETMRQRLIGEIQSGGGIEGVPLNAESQTAAEAEARAKQCDYILYTDISSLKTPKLGGMFGKVTGMGGGTTKTDARVDFKLFAVGESKPRLQSSATAKEEGEEISVANALGLEAKAVIAEVRKTN